MNNIAHLPNLWQRLAKLAPSRNRALVEQLANNIVRDSDWGAPVNVAEAVELASAVLTLLSIIDNNGELPPLTDEDFSE